MNISFLTPPSLRRAALTLGVAAVGALTIGLTAGVAAAQPVRAGSLPTPAQLEDLNGNRVAPAKRGFSLYGLGDLAVAGLQYSGTLTMGFTNYGGPCSDAQALTGCGYINRNGTVGQRIFEIGFVAAAPITEFRKIRTVHPGINGAQAPAGYTMISNSDLLSRPRKWGPADNHIGRLNAGVTTLNDNSCQDLDGFAGGYLNTGLTLMAISNCPQTWPASGFDGVRPIADTTFARFFAAAPDSFRFDYWRVPPEQRDRSQFLGNFSTYGESSDHYAEVLGLYGGVTPRGTGAPSIGGFPLGLTARFDAFTFSRPELASAVFYQVTVINNSADVYGRGIDYDSLYMGLTPGFTSTNTAVYYVPEQNALKAVNTGSNVGCNGGSAAPGVACSTGFRGNSGFGIIMLKSPIGDTRNKLLSKPGIFFNPTSPFADDTITFNHGHLCEFGASCEQTTVGATQRAGFGLASSTEANTLDGRDPAALTSNTLWYTFRNRGHVLNQVSPAFARYNRFVPSGTTNPKTGQPFGRWDYNNDGVADTLFLDSCAEQGCVTAFADTAPGKQTGPGRSQVGGQMNAGPFRLRAGDTTSFIYAFVGTPDSLGFENTVRNAIEAYQTFFLSPNPPPTPRITGVEVRTAEAAEAESGTGGLLSPFVRLRLSNDPELFSDPFLITYANNLATSTTDSALIRLRTLNPGLVDEIRTRAFAAGTRFRRFGATGFTSADSATATGNFADVLIFKSCNAGATFTASTNCQSDRTVDVRGNIVGLGFQAYGRLAADPVTGVFTKSFTDQNVTAGRTYLYSLVTRSRGFTRAVTLSRPGATAGSTVQFDTVITVADTASGVVATSGPTTVSVYVPISRPAGAVASTVNVTTRGGTSTLPVNVFVLENARAAEYRLLFGNQFTVTTRTTLATGEVSTTVVARRTTASARVNNQPVTNFVSDSSVFTTSGRVDFAPATATTALPGTFVTTTAQTRTETYTVNGLGYVALAGTRPLFVSQDLTGGSSTPAGFFSRADFPGVLFSLNQVRADSLVFERIIRANGDTVENSIRDNNAVQFQQASSTRRNGAAGVYQFAFRDDAFGPNVRNFTLGTVPETETQINASLNARAVAQVGDTSTNIRNEVRTIAGFTTATLVARKFPFRVIGPQGDTAILAAVTRTAAQASIVIGNGADTARIVPPADVWVPGDQFFVLQRVLRDSVVAGATVFGDTTIGGQRVSRAIQVRDTVVTFGPVVLGCNTPRVSCNPIRFGSLAATGYLPYEDGTRLVIDYPLPFTAASDINVSVTGLTATTGKLTKTDLAKIRVVPNPYIVQSELDQVGAARTGDPRVLFTGVPIEGLLRIYSVSGQFLQQLRWTAADLNGTGDLAYNLRTREGTDLAAGLYIYTIEPLGDNAGSPLARGKFVVIR